MSYESQLEGLYKKREKLENDAAELYKKHSPKFERGMAEASVERMTEVMKKVKDVFDEYNIACSYSAAMQSEQQQDKDGLPIVVFGGIMCRMEARIFPLDNEGNSKISEEAGEKLRKIEEKMNRIDNKIDKTVGKMHGRR